jgi:hypothetical protein
MRLIFLAILTLGMTTQAIAQKTCDYAGQSYSVGATICECPGLKAENLNWQREQGHITSRRLACSPGQTWTDTNTMCLDAQMTTGTEKTYAQYIAHYCPRLPINFAEIEKAISQETGRLIEKAPKSTIVSMLEGICRRLRLDAPCKALIEAASSSDIEPK